MITIEEDGRGHRQEDGWNSKASWVEKMKFHQILAKRKKSQADEDLRAAKRLIERSKAEFEEYLYHSAMAGQIEKDNVPPVLKNQK